MSYLFVIEEYVDTYVRKILFILLISFLILYWKYKIFLNYIKIIKLNKLNILRNIDFLNLI